MCARVPCSICDCGILWMVYRVIFVVVSFYVVCAVQKLQSWWCSTFLGRKPQSAS